MSSTTDISMKIIDNAAGFSFEQGEVDKLAQAISIYAIILIFVMKWEQMPSKFSKRIMKDK